MALKTKEKYFDFAVLRSTLQVSEVQNWNFAKFLSRQILLSYKKLCDKRSFPQIEKAAWVEEIINT